MQEFQVSNSSPSLGLELGFGNFVSQATRQHWKCRDLGHRRSEGLEFFIYLGVLFNFWGLGNINVNSHPAVPVEKGIWGILGAWGW